MPRPRKPATESVKRIYAVLAGGPLCFEEICEKTGLHRNTVSDTLKVLKDNHMVSKRRNGRNSIYEIIKTKPQIHKFKTLFFWEIPWFDLMTTDEEKEQCMTRREKEVEKYFRQRKLDERVLELYQRFYTRWVEPQQSQEFIGVLRSIGHPISPRLLEENLVLPYCLDCLKAKGKYYHLVQTPEAAELSCEKCGTTSPLHFCASKPIETHDALDEKQKMLEMRIQKESKKPSYKRIEKLLRKYKKHENSDNV